jgi:predicted transposase YdaD
MVHWREHADTLAPVTSALQAAGELPPALRRVYSDLAVALLDRGARETLRKIMATHTQYFSEFARELVEEGREEGREKGREEGREEGERAGLRKALHGLLAARRIELSPAQNELVAACADASQLAAWIARAATATDAASIFA